jgi:hypothetical protein
VKPYSVLKANEWKGHLDQRGNQIWYLEIEGQEGKRIRTSKKPGNVPATGLVYGELLMNDDGQGGYFKYAPKDQWPNQSGSPQAATPSTAPSAPAKDQEGMAWGNSLNNAVAFVVGTKGPNGTMEQVLEVANYFFKNRGASTPVQVAPAVDLPPVENYGEGDFIIEDLEDDSKINLDDIPF